MSRHQVWYVPDSPAEQILAELSDEFVRRPLSDVARLTGAERPGVVVVHYGRGEDAALAGAAAQATGMPLVALIESDVPEVLPDHPCFAYLSTSVSAVVLTAVGIRLSAERNLDALLELILTKGREITRSDAGSLYVVEKTPDGGQCLRFKVAQNDSVRVPFTEFTLAIDTESVAGYVALSGELLRIDDAYALPVGSPFRINPEFDAHVGYRTTSMLVVPMKTSEGEVVGVLQLINRKPESGRPLAAPEALHDEVSPFPVRYAMLAASLASQAGVAIQNAQLLEELRATLQKLEASQQQMVQAERLGALGEMAAGVAHDFNNLLAVIVGRAELLLRTNPEPTVVRDVKLIRQAAWDGAQTVRRIQEFTRTRQTRPSGRVSIPELLHDVVELTRGRWKGEAQSLGVSYEVRVEAGAVPSVTGIASELREVFMNLLINGLDAMSAGGRFTFRVSADAEMVTIAAADTGCGMSEETRRKVLEPFFTTKGVRGTGLGLSVSWGIVKRHGGTIEIESEVGVGSTFVVRLPASTDDVAVPVRELAPAIARPARVLVIDDEHEVRSVLRDVLTSMGHTVVEAASGEEGLACCEREAVDVILADVSMPGMSGWDVAAACRRRFPRVPLGFVTGWGDRLDPEEVSRSGVRFVLSKPFAPVDLQSLVAGVLLPTAPK